MNAEYKDGKILNFQPINDQENVREIMGGGIRQWDAQTQSYRVVRENDCCCQELKDEFNKVILEIEQNPDTEPYDGMKPAEPEGVDLGWIEALRFAITCINTKMEEENA